MWRSRHALQAIGKASVNTVTAVNHRAPPVSPSPDARDLHCVPVARQYHYDNEKKFCTGLLS